MDGGDARVGLCIVEGILEKMEDGFGLWHIGRGRGCMVEVLGCQRGLRGCEAPRLCVCGGGGVGAARVGRRWR